MPTIEVPARRQLPVAERYQSGLSDQRFRRISVINDRHRSTPAAHLGEAPPTPRHGDTPSSPATAAKNRYDPQALLCSTYLAELFGRTDDRCDAFLKRGTGESATVRWNPAEPPPVRTTPSLQHARVFPVPRPTTDAGLAQRRCDRNPSRSKPLRPKPRASSKPGVTNSAARRTPDSFERAGERRLEGIQAPS